VGVIEQMREAGISGLVRNPRLPLSECWMGAGKPDFRLSQREVREAIEAGTLEEKAGVVTIAKALTDREKHAKRSESAQRAAKTRRESPPSASALDLLASMADGGWYAPNTWRDADDMKSLFSKGLVFWGEFKQPGGTKRYYRISGSGCDALVAAGLASYKEATP